MKEALDRLADQILALDPTELKELLPEVQARMGQADDSSEWARSVIAFFLVNAVRFKESMREQCQNGHACAPHHPPRLRVVK